MAGQSGINPLPSFLRAYPQDLETPSTALCSVLNCPVQFPEAATFVSVEVKAADVAAPSSLGDKGIEIRLRRGRSLVVEPGFDASHLHALLVVVFGIPGCYISRWILPNTLRVKSQASCASAN
jgi:hypothetical protein